MLGLPTTLKNCPIKEAVFEIRFEPSVPNGAVYGVIYSALKETYGDSTPLPVLQIPETVRDADPNLIYQPHFRLKRDGFLLQIGPKIFAIASSAPYRGWTEYRHEIVSVFDKLKGEGFISDINRIGLRYINIFTIGILENIRLKIKIDEEFITNTETTLRTVFVEDDEFRTVLQIANDTIVTEPGSEPYVGSMIDVDVLKAGSGLPFLDNIEVMIDAAHEIAKNRFFALLKDELLETLEPEYDEEQR